MKKVIQYLLVVFFSLLISIVGFSKTLIVSDIDDTIKISHVRDAADLLINAYKTTAAFKGMSELYHEILQQNPESEIIYVTNAYYFLMHDSHTQFVKNNNFPQGKIFFRKGSSNAHKYNTIKKYLQKNPLIDRLIMIGDNGERDIEFYNQIEREFRNLLDIKTYIRIVYSQPDHTLALKENQTGFVSPLGVLADLTLNNFIDIENYFELSTKISKEIIAEDRGSFDSSHYFPSWLNCADMEFVNYPQLMTQEIEKAYRKLESICQ